MENDFFEKIWNDNFKKIILISALMMIIGSFIPGIQMNGTSGSWLDTKNYGFLFPLAGVAVGSSLFIAGSMAYIVLLASLAVAGFLVGINLMDLFRAVDFGATLSIGFYVYIGGIAVGAYAWYLNNAQLKGKSAIKFDFKPLITKETFTKSNSEEKPLDTNVIFCPQCGTKNDTKSNFCVQCGTKLTK